MSMKISCMVDLKGVSVGNEDALAARLTRRAHDNKEWEEALPWGGRRNGVRRYRRVDGFAVHAVIVNGACNPLDDLAANH
jgi:hypothetical protein